MSGTDKTYRGERLYILGSDRGVRVTVEGPDEQRKPLRHVEFHSPDGFEWGYGGSGPADLALSILADFFGERPTPKKIGWKEFQCTKYHQDFKWQFIATLPRDRNWVIRGTTIETWVEQQLIVKEVFS